MSRALSALRSIARSAAVAMAALALSLGLIALSGHDVAASVTALCEGALGSPRQLAGTLQETMLLTLFGLAWCVAFRARRVNVGLEGQALVGGIGATAVGLHLAVPGVLLLPLGVVAGVAGGALYAGIAALLWARRGVNEIISTLMLNLVAVQLLAWLVRGPLGDPASSFAQTPALGVDARWPVLWPQTPLTWAIVLGPLAVVAVWFVLERTTAGFAVRATGANARAAEVNGIATRRVSSWALIASGALAGLAGGAIVLAGQSAVVMENFTASRGFEGIAVALLAGSHPVAVPLAALLFAVLQEGGGLMEARVGVPSSLVLITQGLVIALVAAAPALLRPGGRRKASPTGEPTPPVLTSPVGVGRR